MEIWEAKSNEFIDKVKNLFSRGWDAGCDGTLIECIQNDVGRIMRKVMKHFFEAFCHSAIIRLPHSTIVGRMELGENIATEVGLSGKLDEQGRHQVA